MKLRILLSLFVFISIISCSSAGYRDRPVADEVKKFFGEKNISIIMDADKALAYKVKPRKTRETGIKNLYGYPVTAGGPVLSSVQMDRFKTILLDEKTYDFKWAKKAFVFPDYAIELKKGDTVLTVFIDFYRKELLFVSDGKELIEDFDNAEKEMKSLMDEIFK
jgi:hypothetical protein